MAICLIYAIDRITDEPKCPCGRHNATGGNEQDNQLIDHRDFAIATKMEAAGDDGAERTKQEHGTCRPVSFHGQPFGHIIEKSHPVARADSRASTAYLKVVDHLRLYQMDIGTAPIPYVRNVMTAI